MLAQAGISLEGVAEQLVVDGVKLFADAADSLLGAVAAKRAAFLAGRLDLQTFGFAPQFERNVKQTAEAWRSGGWVRRLWKRDATLWTGADEAGGSGGSTAWKTNSTRPMNIARLRKTCGGRVSATPFCSEWAGQVSEWKCSSAPMAIGPIGRAFFFDSTDPSQIRTIETAIEPATTLFIVSSKSGSTIEPTALMAYFFDKVSKALGPDKAGRHFVAITDPGSQLEMIAARDGFRRIFHGKPSIGGRYSVLSPFGMVPAAIAGFDIAHLLTSALTMVHSCGSDVPPSQNPGVRLGIAMATAALAGRNKITILSSPGLETFGGWAEQLIANRRARTARRLSRLMQSPLERQLPMGQIGFS